MQEFLERIPMEHIELKGRVLKKPEKFAPIMSYKSNLHRYSTENRQTGNFLKSWFVIEYGFSGHDRDL